MREFMMDDDTLTEQIRTFVLPVVENAGLELIDMTLKRSSGSMLLVLLVDRTEGGITVEECVRLNRTLGDSLDAQDIIPGRYTLEVSSPGLDRRLKTEKDFMTRLGKQVKFFLAQPVSGRLEWDGIVRRVDATSVEIDAGGTAIIVPLHGINKAHEVVL
jgi:ribosome maturation factor RimP